MKVFVKSALVGLLLGLPGAANAATDDCASIGPRTHEVLVLKNGYFPSTLYACPGDNVEFLNKNTLWVSFTIVGENPTAEVPTTVLWFRPGHKFTFTIPTGQTSLRLEESKLYGGVNLPEVGYIKFTPPPTGK